MAPVSVTEDYYMVLEVVQTATTAQVVQSYRRLALKLHPDRNTKSNATEAFQLLGRAYETLKDETKRRAYDLIYPSITKGRPSPEATKTPRSQNSEVHSEAAQIVALQKSKQERRTRWETTKNAFDSSIFKLQADIRRLELQIKNLDSIAAAEAAKKAQENSWGAWFFSPIYKKVEETEEEKERMDRERQERRIEKDMKERRLESKMADLKNKEGLLRKAKEDVDAADLADDRKIADFQHKIWLKETKERQEKERQEMEKMARERQEKERLERERRAREWQEREKAEKERMAKIRKEQQQQQQQREKREREAAEARKKQEEERMAKIRKEQQQQQQQREKREREAAEARKKQEEERMAKIRKEQQQQQQQQQQREKREREAAEARKKWEEEEKIRQKQMYEEAKRSQERYSIPDHFFKSEERTHQTCTLTCYHDCWWSKVQGRTACPECYEVWTYLLKCPGCDMKACPRCQSAIRPRMTHRTARKNRRPPPRARTPSPYRWNIHDYDYD